MELTAETPTKEITIKGLGFTVPAPFAEGHVLRANEANVLNQTYGENLRNNFAGVVQEAQEKAKAANAEVDHEDLQKQLNAYVTEYDFGVRASGGGAPKMEPRMRIAYGLAKDKIKEKIREQGKKVSDFSAEKIGALALGLVEKDAWYLKEADRQLKEIQKAAADTIDLSELSAEQA